MMKTISHFFKETFQVGDTDLFIVALDLDLNPLVLRERDITGLEFQDVEAAFPLMPYLMRASEFDEEVPDFEEVEQAVEQARNTFTMQQGS